MASSSFPPAIKDGECRNWSELPSELTSSILHRLGAIEILENAQKVCRSWGCVCKDPSIWRKIDMHKLGDLEELDYHLLEKMCRHAVDRSQGDCAEISIWNFGTDNLLNFIAHSSSNLRSLKLVLCDRLTSEGITESLMKLPLLEDLEVSYCSLLGESLKVIGESCPNLKTLKINCVGCTVPGLESDKIAVAIAITMPRLCHLQLFGNRLTNLGLNAILYNCPNLEHLDLRQCFNLEITGDLEKRCSERIKVVRFPNDSTNDYPYDTTVHNMFSFEYEYPSDFDFSDDELLDQILSDPPPAYDIFEFCKGLLPDSF